MCGMHAATPCLPLDAFGPCFQSSCRMLCHLSVSACCYAELGVLPSMCQLSVEFKPKVWMHCWAGTQP